MQTYNNPTVINNNNFPDDGNAELYPEYEADNAAHRWTNPVESAGIEFTLKISVKS